MNAMLSEALQEFTGLLKQLITNLLGNEAELWGSEFRKFCRKEPCWQPVPQVVKKVTKRVLKVWKTIDVGGGTSEQLATRVAGNCEEVSSNANFLMTKMTVTQKTGTVSLVNLSPRELGFTSNPRTDAFMTKEFCAKWSAENLDGYVIELCEAEDGPRLRDQYKDQPNGETLWVAMERIADLHNHPSVFGVGRRDDGHRWLRALGVYLDLEWPLDYRLVFRFRKLL